MLDIVLGWIRQRVKAAALAGLSDALGTLDNDDVHDLAASALVARLQALPKPDDGETAGRKRK